MPSTSSSNPTNNSPFLGLRTFQIADSGVFFGRDRELLEASRAIGNHAEGEIFVITGPAGCGKSSFAQAGLLPHLLSADYPAYASVDLSSAHELRGYCAKALLGGTSQAGAERLSARLADLMIIDPVAAAEFLRDFIRADLPSYAPPTPIVVDHLEQLISSDGADLLPGGTPDQPRAGRDVLATLVELARLPEILVIGTARHSYFRLIQELVPQRTSLFEFRISHITCRSALARVFHTSPAQAAQFLTEDGPNINLRRSAVDLVCRFPATLPFVTSMLARLQITRTSSPAASGQSADAMLLEVMADHADAAMESLSWDVDSGFYPLFRKMFPDAHSLRHSGWGVVQQPLPLPKTVPLSRLGGEWEVRKAVLALINCGILTVKESEFEGTCVEPSFPLFFSRWRFCASWLERCQAQSRSILEIEKRANQWAQGKHRAHLLQAGAERDFAERVASEAPDRLSPIAVEFVNASSRVNLDPETQTGAGLGLQLVRVGTAVATIICAFWLWSLSSSVMDPVSRTAPQPMVATVSPMPSPQPVVDKGVDNHLATNSNAKPVADRRHKSDSRKSSAKLDPEGSHSLAEADTIQPLP